MGYKVGPGEIAPAVRTELEYVSEAIEGGHIGALQMRPWSRAPAGKLTDGAVYNFTVVFTGAEETRFPLAAYAQLGIAPPQPFPALGAGWQPLNIFSTATPAPRWITADTAADTMTFEYQGVYQFQVNGSFGHNSSNQGRTTSLRLSASGTPLGAGFPIGIGRNVEDTVISVATLVEVTPSAVGVPLTLEIGGGSAVSSVVFNALSWSMFAVGGFRDPVPGVHEYSGGKWWKL